MTFHLCSPGNDLAALANAAGTEGDTFYLTPGTYVNQKILPRDGQTWLGEPGSILSGSTLTDYAFYYDDSVRQPHGVTLRGFTVQSYTGGAGRGAIFAANGKAWTLDHLTVTGTTHGRGIDAGVGMIVRGCAVTHNWLAGLTGYLAHGLLIDGCDFSFNNVSGIDPDTATGEGSGVKLGTCFGARIRQTTARHNLGPGIWLDIDSHDAQIVGCLTQLNSHRGIEVEISDEVQILDTTCLDDGAERDHSGIFVSSSSNVEITGCTFHGCQITELNANRGTGPYGVRENRNLVKRRNVMYL